MAANTHQGEDEGNNANAACHNARWQGGRGSAAMHAPKTTSNGAFEATPQNTTIKLQ